MSNQGVNDHYKFLMDEDDDLDTTVDERSIDNKAILKEEPTEVITSPKKKESSFKINETKLTKDLIEEIRKVVKNKGQEPAHYRLTTNEKKQLKNVLRECEDKGMKGISEGDIARIALNYVIADYIANEEKSILNNILSALYL